jgi:hypothetical protein
VTLRHEPDATSESGTTRKRHTPRVTAVNDPKVIKDREKARWPATVLDVRPAVPTDGSDEEARRCPDERLQIIVQLTVCRFFCSQAGARARAPIKWLRVSNRR